MVASRHAQFNTTKGGDLLDASVNTLTNNCVSNPLEDVKDTMPVDQNKLQPKKDEAVENASQSGWDDPKVQAVKNSFADVVNKAISTPKINFRTLYNSEQWVIVWAKVWPFPLFKITLLIHGGKYGFQKVMRDEDGFFFFFKFASKTGLEQGPWMIRNNHIILTKWAPNMSLTKDIVTKVPIWVKMHKVPIVAYSEDGISLIATQIGKPIMLDAFTSAMCADSWGRLGFARAA
ncbi:hypothetical protein Tco_0153837 [Tanacetum coccineum]